MLTLEDILIASKTIWGEARGETYRGKIAVAHVQLNRWRSTTGQWAQDDTLATTCLRPWQFSCWNSNDANFRKMQEIDFNNKDFRECVKALLQAYDEPAKDPTHGSRHYVTTHLLNKEGWPTTWGPQRQPVVTIGSHQFFNNVL